jgi:hypothetical protein
MVRCGLWWRVVLVVSLVEMFAPLLEAQSATATLSGDVVDETNASVPDVAIVVVNSDTALTRQAITSAGGGFAIPLLPPGRYTLRAARDGFAPVEMRDIVLNVGDQVALAVRLTVASVLETLNVTAEPPRSNTSASVGTVVDRAFVENLPMNGRSFQSLIALTPGVVVTKTVAGGQQGQFSANGQRADANYFTVDGVSANIGSSTNPSFMQSGGGALPAMAVTGGTNNLVSVDALQEFNIQTSTYAPEFGRSPGAQVQIVTRAGTNQLHGSAFEYFRDDALDATDWFANRSGLSKARERQHDFGGVAGGPVVKNRLFFFVSYEGLQLRLPQTQNTSVPSVDVRQSAPAALRPYLNAYPVPNGRVLTGGFAEFNASYSEPSSLNATSVRIDHRLGDRVSFFGRYNEAPSDTTQRGDTVRSLNILFKTRLLTRTLTGATTQTIGARAVNELRANYSRSEAAGALSDDDFGGAVPLPTSLAFPSFADPENSSFQFQLTGNKQLLIGKLAANVQRQVNVVDNLSLVTGRHQLKFGVDYRRLSPINNQRDYEQIVTFSGLVGANGAPTPGTVMSGIASRVFIRSFDPLVLLTQNWSAYAQDTWNVTPRATLTYGVRWEVNPPIRGLDGHDLYTVTGLERPASIALAPPGTPFYKTTYTSLAPRVGLAYQLSNRPGRETTVRGGFGVFYDLGTGTLASSAGFFPYQRSKTINSVAYPIDPQLAPAPAFSTGPPVVTIVVAQPNLVLPRTYEWNVTLERSLGTNQVVSVAYVGAAGRDLLRNESLRNPNADFTGVTVVRNAATSDYRALQLQYRRRLSGGFHALASYTWARSTDIASDDTGNNAAAGFIDPEVDRGPSDFDIRHSFNGAVFVDIPSPRSGRFVRSALGGWSFEAIVTARSAPPVNLIGQTSTTGFSANLRPDVVPGAAFYIDDPTAPGGWRYNRGAFQPPAGPQGTLGRNALRGFPAGQIDLGLHRDVAVTHGATLQVKAEVFNVLNHPNFADPVADISSAQFGQATQMLGRSLGSGGFNGGFNPLYQIGGPRSVQLAVRVQF